MKVEGKRNRIILLVTLLLIAWLIYFAVDYQDVFAVLLSISPHQVAVLFITGLGSSLIGGLTRKIMAQKLGITLAVKDWYGLTMVGNLLSMILPGRGELIVSAYYLRSKCGLPLTSFASITYGNSLLAFGISSFQGLIGLIHFWYFHGYWISEALQLVTVVGIITLSIFFIPPEWFSGESWISSKLRMFIGGWQLIRCDTYILSKLLLLTIAGSFVFTLNTYFAYSFIGYTVGIGGIMFASAIIQLSFFAAITPGNLGIKEAVTGLASYAIGVGFAEGIVVSVLQRAVAMIVYFLVGGFFGIMMLNDLRKE